MKRAWLILLPLFISLSLVVGAYLGIKPTVREWVKTQLELQIEQRSPIKITIKDFNWKLLWPSIWLEGVEIPQQASIQSLGITGLKMGKVVATLDPFSILLGRFSLAAIEIKDLKADFNADAWIQTEKAPSSINLKPLFDVLKKLPISQVATFQAEISISSEQWKSALRVKDFSLVASNKKSALELELVLRGADIRAQDQELPLSLLVSSELTSESLSLRDFQLHVLNSYLEAKADFLNVSEIFLTPEGQVQWELFADLKSLRPPLLALTGLKNIQGQIKIESDLKFKGTNFGKSKAEVFGKDLALNQFQIGDLNFSSQFNENSIEIPEIQLTNSAGLLDLKKIKMNLKNGIALENAHLRTEFIDLHEFLKLLGLGDLPLEAFLEAGFDCSGPLTPEFKLSCTGGFQGSELEVRSGSGIKNTVVQISSYGATGKVDIDREKVSYQAKLQILNDQGQSTGEIRYQEGFKIGYSAENFKFDNFKHLAGLSLRGVGNLSGQTEGDSSKATFFIDLKGQDVLFENFYLGAASTRLSYKSSVLSMSQLQGQIDKTTYRSDLAVNLAEGTIQGSASSELFETKSVLKVFEQIFQLPFEINSSGKFQAKFSGPLRLGALSYDLDVSLNSGEVLGESFDRVEFQASSNTGQAKIKKAFLQKGKVRINLSGTSDPRGNLDWKVSSDQLYLEESENVNRLGAGITGMIKFDMTLKDHILKPLMDLNLEVTQLLLNEQEFPNSRVTLKTSAGALTGTADLFSGKLVTSFHLPLGNQGHFDLDVTANDWNYTTLFALIGGGDLLSDYQAGLTGQLKLRSDSGGIFKSTGSGSIQKLFLKRGTLSVQNKGEMRLTMNQGLAQLENFKVAG
ncbi:MAG: hypothetical protein LW875_09730, partial [Proteobacteria bacterium]|nr:hypothetical protein [Pseudomonadota bacterium]